MRITDEDDSDDFYFEDEENVDYGHISAIPQVRYYEKTYARSSELIHAFPVHVIFR